MTSNIPDILKKVNQWVIWTPVQKENGKIGKPPRGRKGANEWQLPENQYSFHEAFRLFTEKKPANIGGIGIAFNGSEPFTGLDLDNCLNDEKLEPWARSIVDECNSYTEISPSGNGLRIFVSGKIPDIAAKRKFDDLEIFSATGYVTVTGKVFENRKELIENIPAMTSIYKKYSVKTISTEERVNQGAGALPPCDITDEMILTASKNDRNFQDLRSKQNSEDHSKDDLALCLKLAFYSNNNTAQIDRLFRKSALMREKWDTRHGTKTYGQMTIEKACQEQDKSFDWSNWNKPKTEKKTEKNLITLNPAKQPYKNAEIIVRELFMDALQRKKLVHYAGMFLAWNDGRYSELYQDTIRNKLYSFLDKAVVNEKNGPEPFSPTKAKLENILDALKAYVHLSPENKIPSWLYDADGCNFSASEIVACQTKLLHLPTLKTFEPTPAFFTTTALSFDYKSDAPQPEKWLSFLNELWENDAESIESLQKWFGYFISGETRQQKMLLVVGPKRSGKGTIARVLYSLFGEKNICNPTTLSLTKQFGLEPLLNKSLAIVSDARFRGRPDDISTLTERLLCISGEDNLTVDRKWQTSVTLKLPTRFMFLSNELPQLPDAAGALSSRFIVLETKKSFYGKEDLDLTEKLLAELPGIFCWALDGWKKMKLAGKLTQPKASEDLASEMEKLGSPVKSFVQEQCLLNPNFTIETKTLFSEWLKWCDENHIEKQGTAQMFGRNLKAACPDIGTPQHRDGEKIIRLYTGITLDRSKML